MSGGWLTMRARPSTRVVSFASAWTLSLGTRFVEHLLRTRLAGRVELVTDLRSTSSMSRWVYQTARLPIPAKPPIASR